MARTLIATVLLTVAAAVPVVAAYREATAGAPVPPVVPSTTWHPVQQNYARGPARAGRLFEDVAIRSDGVGLAVRRLPPRLMRTTDGGHTWTDAPVPQQARMAVALRADGIALLVGFQGVVHRSTDAGKTWKKTFEMANTDSVTNRQRLFRRVRFGNGNSAIAVGDGIVMRSTDAGLTWTRFDVPLQDYNDLDFRGRVWLVVGGSGLVLRSSDDCATWTHHRLAVRNLLRGVAFTDDNTAIAVGSGGVILRSEDAGLSWKEMPSGTTHHLRAVAFADAQNGWAAGFYGTLLRTSDGGRSWQAEESGTRGHLFHVTITSDGLPLSVGYFDTILLRTPFTATAEAHHER